MIANEITVKQIVLPAGYTMRPGTLEDLPQIVPLCNACSMETMGINRFNLEEFRTEWQTPGLNLEEDTRVILNANGKIVAVGETWAVNDPPVNPNVWARIQPDYKGLGLGTYLLNWGEARARQAIPRVPAEARVVLSGGIEANHKPARKLFENNGYKSVRHFWDMKIMLNEQPPQPQWPTGIKLAPYHHPDDLMAVLKVDNEAFRDHWGHVERPLEKLYQRWTHWIENDKDFDPGLWYLAMDGDEIAAICLCTPKAYDDPTIGWVNILGVLRPWRRQGLALALLHNAFGEFYRRGFKAVGLGVDASNLTGATRLYEKAGMFVDRQFVRYEKELRPGINLAVEDVAG